MHMGLGKRKTGGDYLPVWKWDARTGKACLQDRVYSGGRWETEQRNIDHSKFRAVFDMENVLRGWINFPSGAPPEMKMVRAGEDPGDPPSDKHKEGVRLIVKMDESLGGGVRELLSTAWAMWTAIDALHDAYTAAVVRHPGHLPAVDIVDVREERTAAGTSYAPVFKIVGWVPRPPELPVAGTPITQRTKAAQVTAGHAVTRPRVRDDFADEIPF
jgi:hypothetical protein